MIVIALQITLDGDMNSTDVIRAVEVAMDGLVTGGDQWYVEDITQDLHDDVCSRVGCSDSHLG